MPGLTLLLMGGDVVLIWPTEAGTTTLPGWIMVIPAGELSGLTAGPAGTAAAGLLVLISVGLMFVLTVGILILKHFINDLS